jgi:hypothetical protein
MTASDVSGLYREFTDALTEVLAENAGNPARRGRLARAHVAVKKHPDYSEHEYFLAVEAAFALASRPREISSAAVTHWLH